MQNSATIVESINLQPPLTAIYSRLGFRKKSTEMSDARRQATDRHIAGAAPLIALQGAFLRLPVSKNDGQRIQLKGRLSFTSAKLCSFIGDCREAVLMAATAGHPIMAAIREKTSQGDLTAAVIYDATASEMTDAALDWIMKYLNGQLLREGKRLLPRRFSAGYGDLALDNQQKIYEKLQMARIGVTLTPDYLMLPEKTVTAIGGII